MSFHPFVHPAPADDTLSPLPRRSFAVGALCSAFAFIYLKVSNPSYVQANGNVKSVVIGSVCLASFVETAAADIPTHRLLSLGSSSATR